MKKRLCVLFLGSILAARAAGPSADDKIFLDSESSDNEDPGKVIVTEWYVTPEHVAKLPAFQPMTDDPPLSLKGALAVAQAALKKHLTAKMTWSLDSVELHQIDAGDSGSTEQEFYTIKDTGKWFYKVIFNTERPDPKTGVYSEPYPVYVLMDGTTALRRERPQTKEEIEEAEQFGEKLKAAVLKSNARDAK